MSKPSKNRFSRSLTAITLACLCVDVAVCQEVTTQLQAPHIRQVLDAQYRTRVRQHHSQIIVADSSISRVAITAPEVANFVQYGANEIAIVGLTPGSTDLTMWFHDDPQPVMYDVEVISGTGRADRGVVTVDAVAEKLTKVFPRSQIQLVSIGDQLAVRGQAWDSAEAEQIVRIVSAQFSREGRQVVNMLRVPGEFQVMLRVRIAELDRTQLRRLGFTPADLLKRGRSVASFGPTTAGVSGVFETDQMHKLVKWLCSKGTITFLAEPSLTVLSGHSASFLSGGEFAVTNGADSDNPTTQFRGYGTSLKVTPTVLDRDLIRLKIAPEFSQLDDRTTVNGVPGTNVRRVETVVELREGQTIAIGGLVARQMQSRATRHLGGLGRRLFSRRHNAEAETELLIVVTPEIVRPMDPGEVPPLPGYGVARPNNAEFFVAGRTESRGPGTNAVITNSYSEPGRHLPPVTAAATPPVDPLKGSSSLLPSARVSPWSPPATSSESGGRTRVSAGADGVPLFDLPTGTDAKVAPPYTSAAARPARNEPSPPTPQYEPPATTSTTGQARPSQPTAARSSGAVDIGHSLPEPAAARPSSASGTESGEPVTNAAKPKAAAEPSSSARTTSAANRAVRAQRALPPGLGGHSLPRARR